MKNLKRALIIGVLGFVGEYLTQELVNNSIEVYGADIKECNDAGDINACSLMRKLLKIDLIKREDIALVLKEIQPDYIINLAGISSVKLSWQIPALTFDVNVKGVVNIFEAIKETGINPRVLLIGSSEEYGITNGDKYINEDAPLNALNPYGISKVTQERIALMYKDTFGIDVLMVRAFNHIGPRQQLGFVLPDFANQIAKIEKFDVEPVLYVGNLKAERDFTDVRDVVRGYRLLLEKGKSGEVYNIGSGYSYSIEKLLDKLVMKSSKNIEIRVNNQMLRPKDTPTIICDNSKIKNSIGWEPEINIDETLEDVLQYWRAEQE